MALVCDVQARALPTLRSSIPFADMNEREYAAQQLLGFLKHVGPVEAVWAMTTALEALEPLPHDHVAAAAAALDESIAEFSELEEAAEPAPAPADPSAPPAPTDAPPEGDEAPQGDGPPVDAPPASGKKAGKTS